MRISAQQFWNDYREQLRADATQAAYALDPTWTPIAKDAAEKVCLFHGLKTSREYFRLDVAGWEYRTGSDYFDWDLRVAFEHENCSIKGKDWCDELCKLTHLVADLRVLVGYFKHRRGDLEITLQDRVTLMGPRMARV